MQFLIPWAITFSMFGGIGGDPQETVVDGNTQQVWIQNAALVWVPVMTVLAVLAFFLMNNLPQHPCGPTPVAIGKYLWLQTIGFVGAGVGVVMLVFVPMPIPELVRIFVVLIVAVIVTLLGTILGMPIGYLLTVGMAMGYDSELFRFPVILSPGTLVLTLAMAVLFGTLAHLFVQRSIHRMDWLEALKAKE